MITGIQATDPIAGAAQAAGGQAMGKDAFMKLLVNQIRNQDPMAPTDNQQFIAQLAQFSSLEQMQTMNENIVGLAVLQQNNALLEQLTSSSALIGQQVTWADATTGVERSGVVSSVKIVDGLAVLRVGAEDVPLATVVQVDEPAPPPVGDADANTGTNTGTNAGTNNDEAADGGDNGEG
ncbi:MAG: flagellar hook capping FlgD N-terminal domain-containing protein [Planctomycetia bacterium]|jgi:flagellar basal-body rod modification protein FlgD